MDGTPSLSHPSAATDDSPAITVTTPLPDPLREATGPDGQFTKRQFSAIVAGATGALGRELVAILVQDPEFTRVVALTRQHIEPSQWHVVFPNLNLRLARKKLVVSRIDWEPLAKRILPKKKKASVIAADNSTDPSPRLEPAHDDSILPMEPPQGSNHDAQHYDAAAFTGHTHACNCMGTTFAAAKSVGGLRRVDRDYAFVFMALLRRHNGTRLHYTQVSYNGASPRSILPYQRIKGKTDNVVKTAGFDKYTILRPGVMGRHDKTRLSERVAAFFLVSRMPVEKVASAIVGVWRGLYRPPRLLHCKLHNRFIHEAAGNYEARRCHEMADIPAPRLATSPGAATPANTSPSNATPASSPADVPGTVPETREEGPLQCFAATVTHSTPVAATR